MASVGKFPIKNAFLGVTREKISTFSPWSLLFVCCSWNVSRSKLFLESSSVLRIYWLHAWLHIWSTTMVGFLLHDTYNLHTQIYFNSNTNVHIHFLPIWKISNIPGTNGHRKTQLLVPSVQKLWTPLFYRQPPIGQADLLYFPHFWQYLLGNIVQMKYRTNTQKNSQKSSISSKQHYMYFISDTFIGHIRWDLVQNNKKVA